MEIDYDLKLAKPELFLLKPNGYENIDGIIKQKTTTVAKLTEAFNINQIIKLSNVNELEFNLPYFIEFNHQIIDNPHIPLVKEKYIIKLVNKDTEDYYLIDEYVDEMDEDKDFKIVKCLGLPIELQQTYLLDFNVNNERGFTVRQVLTGHSEGSTIDERNGILRKTNWTVGYIAPEYDGVTDTGLPFVIRGSSTVLNAILSIGQMYKCTIDWDTKNRKINIYAPQSIGSDKGLTFSYGHYLKTLSNELKTDKLVTRLYIYGKDDLSIELVSPLGQNYVEDYTFFIYPFERNEQTKEVIQHSNYMSNELCHALLNYKNKIEIKKDELKTLIDDWQAETVTLNGYKIDMYKKEQELIRKQDQHYIYYALRDNAEEFESTGLPYTQEEYDRFTEEMGGDELWQAVVEARTIYEQSQQLVSSQEDVVQIKRQLVDNLRNELSEQNNFTPELLKEKQQFTFEREFRDNNQVNPNRLYDRGLEEFAALQLPEKTITIDIVNFLDCIEEQWNWNKLKLSEIVTIRNETLKVNIKARIIEINFNYEDGNIELTISTVDDLDDDYTKLANLINKLISTSIQVEQTVPIWEELQDGVNYVSAVINQFYDSVAEQVRLAVNQSVIIDQMGISVFQLLSDGTRDEQNFLRITNGCLAITDNFGESFKNAITSEGSIKEKIKKHYLNISPERSEIF